MGGNNRRDKERARPVAKEKKLRSVPYALLQYIHAITMTTYRGHYNDPRYLPEVWAWFGIGCLTLVLRYTVRIRTVGFRGFQGDDYIMAFAFIMYMLDAILVTLIFVYGDNVDFSPQDIASMTDAQIRSLEAGSRAQLAAWFTYTNMLWCMKFCMLFFYKRLTIGTVQHKTVHRLMWVCGLTYIVVFLNILLSCRPFWHNWKVRPIPSKNCTFKPQNFWVTAAFNVATDAIILIIPIPMLWKLKVSVRRKLAIAVLLSSGVFVIAAAFVRAALTLSGRSSSTNINTWGVRETIVGLIAVNVPIMRPIVTRRFWRRGAYTPSFVPDEGGKSSRPESNITGATTMGSWRRSRAGTGATDAPGHSAAFELHTQSSSSGGGAGDDKPAAAQCSSWPRPPGTRESEERIIGEPATPRPPSPAIIRGGVTVVRSYHVQSEEVELGGERGHNDDDENDDDNDDESSIDEWERSMWRGRAGVSPV